MERNNKLSNLPDNNRISGKTDAIQKQLILVINRDLFPKLGSSDYLDLLPSDGDSKMV